MSPAGVTPWVRALAAALLGLAVIALSAAPARAGGCQAEDRPAIGLTYARDLGARPDTSQRLELPARHAPRVRPLPCSGQSPASVAHDPPTAPALSATVECLPRPSDGFPPPVDGLLSHALTRPSRLDRPPRSPLRNG